MNKQQISIHHVSHGVISRFLPEAEKQAYEAARDSLIDVSAAHADRLHGEKSPGFYTKIGVYKREWTRCFLDEMNRRWQKEGKHRFEVALQDILSKHEANYRRFRKAQLLEELTALNQLDNAEHEVMFASEEAQDV